MANNYTNEIESNIDSFGEISSKLKDVVEVVEKYEGSVTDDATVHVDNENNTISVTLNKKSSGTESFLTLQDLVNDLNSKGQGDYEIGTEILLAEGGVPDFWVFAVSDTYVEYQFTTKEALLSEVQTNLYVQIGYYLLAISETDLSNYVSKEDMEEYVDTKIAESIINTLNTEV